MGERLEFNGNFYDALESAKNSFDAGLIYLIHLLQSRAVPEDQKQQRCNDIVGIGDETNAFFSSVKIGDLTKYNIKEFEQRVQKKLADSTAEIERFMKDIDKKYALSIDKDYSFAINDIVRNLSESRIYGNYALTKDKLDNLLVIRRFIIGVYESMTTNSAEKEKEKGVETSFFDLKLKTFIAELRNAANRNPDIFFYSVSLVQKLVLEGKRASIAESGKDVAGMDEVFFRIGGENDISIDHDFGGKKIHCRIAKRTKAESLAYEIEGSLQIGGEVVDFRIDEEKPRSTSGSFEHVAGVDWMMAQYDKAFLAYSKEYNGMKDRLEEHSRKTIIDAARDRLFGKDDASGSQ